jgi:hypothetical protein
LLGLGAYLGRGGGGVGGGLGAAGEVLVGAGGTANQQVGHYAQEHQQAAHGEYQVERVAALFEGWQVGLVGGR